MIDGFIERLLTLRQSPSALGLAPHKPILLLTIFDLIENKCVNNNHFYLNEDLYNLFERNWAYYVQTRHTCNLKLPFYHLQNDLVGNEFIWQVITTSGTVLDHYIAGDTVFRNTVSFGKLHPTLYSYLTTGDHLHTVKQLVLNRYFPETSK